MSDRHEELLGVAAIGAVAAATVHERRKTGKWPLAAKVLGSEVIIAVTLLIIGGISPGHDANGNWNGPKIQLFTAAIMMVPVAIVTFAWLVTHLVRQSLKAIHPSNFPQFENRPVPELAREIVQTAGRSNMTERYIILHHDPTTRQVIMVPGTPDRIQCQADGFWYDWNQHVGAYVFSEV